MMIRLRHAPAVAAASLAVLLLAGCSASPAAPTPSATVSASQSADVLPPVMAELSSVDGTTVTVPLGQVVVLNGDGKDLTDWSATIADPAIASFVPGRDDGSAQFNPGLTPLAEGSTSVTLDNSTSGAHVVFTLEVTAKK